MILSGLHDFDQLIYFGDSLVDAFRGPEQPGGTFDLSTKAIFELGVILDGLGLELPPGIEPIPISPPYAMQFSNGPVYSQVTPALLGVDNASVFNFAFGGAEVLGEQTLLDLGEALIPDGFPLPPPALLPPSLTQNVNLTGQLELFAETFAETPISENSAAFLGFGLNDISAFGATAGSGIGAIFQGLGLASQIVEANLDAAALLAEAGVGTIVINTLPATTFFPGSAFVAPEAQVLGDLLVDLVNIGLKLGAAELEQQGVNVEIVDLHAIAGEVADDFGSFGFLAFEQPVLLGDPLEFVVNPAVLGIPMEQIAFFDFLHPTKDLHGIFGAYSARSLTSEVDIRGDFSDLIFGTRQNDLVLASGGNDLGFLRGGDDVAFGGLGDDTLLGGRGSDLIAGGSGDDELFGGRHSDVLAGSAGDDTLSGGSGADGLVDGLGSDELFGNGGNDFFFYTQASLIGGADGDEDLFVGGGGNDTVVLALSAETRALAEQDVADNFESGDDFLFQNIALALSGIENVVFSDVSEGLGFDDVPLPDGDLGDRLAEADLFGVI